MVEEQEPFDAEQNLGSEIDQEKNGVNTEAVAVAEQDFPPETQEENEEQLPVAAKKVGGKSKEDNLRILGRANEELKRRNDELTQALLRFAPQKAQPPPVAEEPSFDDLDSLDEEDFVSVKQVKKLASRIAQESVKKALNEGRVDRLEESFKSRHSDYDQVVNKENFEEFFQEMPEMKAVLTKAYELASKGDPTIDPVALSYKLLSRFKGQSSHPQENQNMTQQSKKIEDRLQKNQSRPLSGNSIKSSALTEANKYMNSALPSQADRERIYKETVEAAKQRR